LRRLVVNRSENSDEEGDLSGDDSISISSGDSDNDTMSAKAAKPGSLGPREPSQQQQGQPPREQWPRGIPPAYAAPLTNPAVRAWLRASRELIIMRVLQDEVRWVKQ
jgi:hypothetical protein